MKNEKKVLPIIATLLLLVSNLFASDFLSGVSGTVAYGRNTDSDNDVYAIALTAPVSQYFAVSVIGANDGGRWLASAATVQLGDKWAVTDKISLCANLGSGIAYDIFTQRPTIYSFTDAGADYKLTSHLSIGGKVIVANLADRKGIDILGALSIGYKF